MSTNDFGAYLIRDAYEREAAMVTARAEGKAILAAAKAGTNKETQMDKFEFFTGIGAAWGVILASAWVVGILGAVFWGLSIAAEWLRCAC